MPSIRWKVKCAAKPKFPTRKYHRCELCGRSGAYMNKFRVCRLCFRKLALAGEIPGLRKSSW